MHLHTGWVVVIALALLLGAALFRSVSEPAAETAKRAFIVADEKPNMEVLAALLADNGWTADIIHPTDCPDSLADYDAGFMYIHGPMNEHVEGVLIRYAEQGGRLIVLHHGIASARRNNPAWTEFTGIYMAPRDDPDYPWKVEGNTTHTLVNLHPGHYITTHKVKYDRTVEYTSSDAPSRPAKLPAVDLENTEVFLNQHVTDGRVKTVLFGLLCESGGRTVMQDRSGWLKRTGKGWLIYLQPGHAPADYRNPAYAQILLNTLTWRPPER